MKPNQQISPFLKQTGRCASLLSMMLAFSTLLHLTTDISCTSSLCPATSAQALKLLTIDRELGKSGLHRLLVTNVTFRAQNPKELSMNGPSLIFKETVTKDAYVYIEEIEKLEHFDFFPKMSIDIEKPSSVSKEHTLVWRLPINETLRPNAYVKYSEYVNQNLDANGKIDKSKLVYPVDIFVSVQFEYHLRYQPVEKNGTYKYLSIANQLEVYLEPKAWSESNLMEYYPPYRAKVMPFADKLVNLLNDKQVEQGNKIFVKFPVGDSNLENQIKIETLSLTLFGMLFLLHQMCKKSGDQVKIFSDFDGSLTKAASKKKKE